MENYYSLNKILLKKDLNNEEPELLIICGNRTAGKTFAVKKYLLDEFLKTGKQFMILVRYIYELDGTLKSFMSDLISEYPEKYKSIEYEEEGERRGLYRVIKINHEEAGFIVYLNSAEAIKKCSTRFYDVENMMLDEFQTNSHVYLDNEIEKFMNIHTSIARGHGKHIRFVKTFLVGNLYSIINPYFCALGIHKRLSKETKFLRGEGYVMELTFNANAAKDAELSSFNRAFKNTKYYTHLTSSEYLIDNRAFIEKVNLAGAHYECTLIYKNMFYGVWSLQDIIFCSRKYDPGFPRKYAVSREDHGGETISLTRHSMVIQSWRRYFQEGYWRFEDEECKNVVMELVGY